MVEFTNGIKIVDNRFSADLKESLVSEIDTKVEDVIDDQLDSIEKMQTELQKKMEELEQQKIRALMHKGVDYTCDTGIKVKEGAKVAGKVSKEKSKDAFYYFGVAIEYTGKGINLLHTVIDVTVKGINKVAGFIYRVTGRANA